MKGSNLLLTTGGVSALLVLALGVVGAGLESDQPMEAPPRPPPKGTSTLSTLADGGEETGAGRELLARFAGCKPGEVEDKVFKKYRLKVVLATVTDPVDANIDWAFDGSLEALRGALGAAGYVICDSYLPWYDEAGKLRQRGANETLAPWESSPGVLLFRKLGVAVDKDVCPEKPFELCLLYLIGEAPNSGVWKSALVAALDEISGKGFKKAQECQRNAHQVRIVGPFFSGSSRSLRIVLDDWMGKTTNAGFSVRLISGTATSYSNLREFMGSRSKDWADCADVYTPVPAGEICFSATTRTDDDLTELFEATSSGRRVALLQEHTTAYGQGASVAPGGQPGDSTSPNEQGTPVPPGKEPDECTAELETGLILKIPFSMNISGLRAAFESNPEAKEPRGGLELLSPKARIPLSLRVGRRRFVNEVASVVTPPYLDAALDDIVATLLHHRIDMVGILATDVRDTLFLAVQIKRRMRDVQLSTFESNRLFLWPEFSEALRGMLVYSSYPLIHSGRDLAKREVPWEFRPFAFGGAQGIYNAAVMQLGSRELKDYPPPVWMTAVGRGSFLPVRMQHKGFRDDRHYLALSGDHEFDPGKVKSDIGLEALSAVLGLAALALATKYLVGVVGEAELSQWTAVQLRAFLARMAFPSPPEGGQPPGEENIGSRYCHIERVSLAIHRDTYAAALFLVMCTFLAPFLIVGSAECVCFPPIIMLGLWLVLVVVGAGFLLATVRSLSVLKAGAREGWDYAFTFTGRKVEDVVLWWLEIIARFAVVVVALCFGFLSISYYLGLEDLGQKSPDGQPLVFLMQRLLALDSGLSPLVPLALLGLILGFGFAWDRARVEFLWAPDPFRDALLRTAGKEPGNDAAPGMWCGVAKRVEELRVRLFRVVPDQWSVLLAVFLIAMVLSLISRFAPGFGTVEPGPGAEAPWSLVWLMRLGAAVSVAVIPWNTCRFLSGWAALRGVLLELSVVPLRAALGRVQLPKRISEPSGLESASELARLVAATAAEPWRRLRAEYEDHAQAIQKAAEDACLQPDDFSIAMESGPLDRPKAATTGDAAPCEADTGRAEQLLAKLQPALEGLWVRGVPDDGDAPLTKWRTQAEDVVAIHAAGFVAKVLGHLWSLAAVLLVTLILASVLLSSYPFGSQGLMKLIFMFVLAGTVVAFVVAMFQMNRNDALSAMTGTGGGRVTWNRNFVFRLLLFGFVPLLTFVGTEFPIVRDLLFSWIKPVLDGLAR